MERATGLEPAWSAWEAISIPGSIPEKNRPPPAKLLLEFSAWREVRQKVRQISIIFQTGHWQEKNRRAPTKADALR